MRVKVQSLKRGTVAGVAGARLAVSTTDRDGACDVVTHVTALDSFGMPHVAAVVFLSPAEAREHARRLLEAADAAENGDR